MLAARRAELSDLPALVALHRANVDPSEFSMMLPDSLVREFYRLSIVEPESNILVLYDDDRLIGATIGWADHPAISRKYQRKVAPRLAVHLVGLLFTGKFGQAWKIIQYALERPAYDIPKDVLPYCVHMTILNKASRTNMRAVKMFFGLFAQIVETLRTKSGGKIWAAVHEQNHASIRMVRIYIKPTEEHFLRLHTRQTTCFISRLAPEPRA